MKGLLLPPHVLVGHESFGIHDHFTHKNTAQWTTTAPDTGTASIIDAAGGVIQLAPSDGTIADNDEVYLLSVNEIFRIAAGKPMAAEALIQFTQAATNAANVGFGFMDAVGANALQDNGAGPKATFSGAVIYCRDGSLNWHCCYSDGATQTIVELTAAASLNKRAMVAGGSAYQLLQIDIVPKTSTLVAVIFRIDGSTVCKMLDRTYANATESMLFAGAKNGTAAQQLVNVDMLSGFQAL